MIRGKALAAAAGLVGGLLAAAAIYATLVEPAGVVRTELEVPVRGLPRSFEGYTILHISDFEARRPGSREEAVRSIAREAAPDAVLVTGDLVDKGLRGVEYVRALEAMALFLGSLDSEDGVYFVEGHGESRSGDSELRQILSASGVTYLKDDVIVLRRGGDGVALAGLGLRDYGAEGEWAIQNDLIQHGPGFAPHYLEWRGSRTAAAKGGLELTGRFRFTHDGDRVGFLLNSRLGDGENRFYMVARRPPAHFITATTRGGEFGSGRISRAESVTAGIWHNFRAGVENRGDEILVRARTWRDGSAEPETWDLVYSDASTGRIAGGSAGLYVEGPGQKSFAGLRVEEDAEGEWVEPPGNPHLLDLLARAPAGAPLILASHTPDILPDAAELGVPLVLAGHTQGGQVRLPWLGPLTTDTRVGGEYASGLRMMGATRIFVTRGVGTSRIPVRFLVPPEAAVLKLTGAPGR